MPASNGEASSYRTSGLTELDIWLIGTEYVAKPRNKLLRARGDTTAATITSLGLEVTPAPQPHPRHTNITNWPHEDSEKKLVAIELANSATLELPPS